MEEYFKKIYYTPKSPASFSSSHKLYQQLKKDGKNYSKKDLNEWLKSQETYTLFKPFRVHIDRPRVISPYYGYQFDGDTIFLKKWQAYNMKYNYVMLLIDIATRYVWTIPMKSLLASESVFVLTVFFENNHCENLRTDNGPEWKNALVKKLLEKKKIKHILTRNTETKANFAERAIQTIRNKLTKNLYFEQTYRWIDDLQNITDSYNRTYHDSIQMTPIAATKADPADVWGNQYLPRPSKQVNKLKIKRLNQVGAGHTSNYKFEIGDAVRIAGLDHPFRRHYDEKWSHELFTVVGRHLQQGFEKYTIKSWANELIDGAFYKSELQKVNVDLSTVYKIEKVIKKRTRNKQRQVLVRWLGWPKKYDTWLPESDLEDINS